MKLKVMPNYVLVFAVRGKRKVGSLYSPTVGSLADYHEVQPIWLTDFGKDCKIVREGASAGVKGFIIDAYELEDLPLYLWYHYRKHLPEQVVQDIESEAKAFDGFITANVVHEDSIFAIEEPSGRAATSV